MAPVIHSQSPTESICDSIMSCIGTSGFTSTTAALPLTIPSHSSPVPQNVDTFISDLLQAVTADEIPLCSSCEEGTTASSRCRDCSEMLCNPCVQAHQRVRITKDHRIVKFTSTEPIALPDSNITSTTSGLSSLTSSSMGSSSLASSSPCSSGLGTSNNYCDLHNEPHRLYCESCFSSTCTDCILHDHRGHRLVYIQDAFDVARGAAAKLGIETRGATVALREAIDAIQRMIEGLEIRSHQAATDVRNVFKRYISAMEERERDLLTHIEQMRQIKGKHLQVQKENLRLFLAKMARSTDLLNESVESGSTLDIIMANERAASDLKRLRALKAELAPCEDDGVVFMPPDPAWLRAIPSLGTITTVATSNMLRTRTKEQQPQVVSQFLPPMELKVEPEIHVRGGPRGRPVYGVTCPVIVQEMNASVIQVFGTEGEEDGQLCRPWGVCCDQKGQIIVADRSNNRIQVFNPDGSFSHKFGAQGTGPGQFDRPAGIALDSQNRLVVADKDNHRIQIFTIDGTFILMFGEKGCRNGQFNYPWDVACNSLGHIVVSDTRNHRIQLFSEQGAFLNKYGFEGTSTMWKHFDSPRGVCFTPSGSVVVTDFNNHRLVIIDSKFMQAQFLGQEGSGYKQFMRPQGIVCDDDGRIVVADSRNHRIQVFECNGTFLWKTGQIGRSVGDLDRPSGICLNPGGRIIVVDFGNNRVQIF